MAWNTVKKIFPADRYATAVGFMTCLGLMFALFLVQQLAMRKKMEESKAGGLASVSGGIMSGYYTASEPRQAQAKLIAYDRPEANRSAKTDASDHAFRRKIVRKGSLNIVVKDTDAVCQDLQRLARELGGYVVSAERNSADSNGVGATVSIRVPAERLEDAWADIRKMAFKIESENMAADDVTKQYVDMEASLRNYRAEESQYIQIMHQAKSVDDTLAVSEHLSEVRGRIEKLQGEFQFLQHDIEMSLISIQIRPRPVVKDVGMNWHPLASMSLALRDTKGLWRITLTP